MKSNDEYYLVEVTIIDDDYYKGTEFALNPPKFRSLFMYDHPPSVLDVKSSLERDGVPFEAWRPQWMQALKEEWKWDPFDDEMSRPDFEYVGYAAVRNLVVIYIYKREMNQ